MEDKTRVGKAKKASLSDASKPGCDPSIIQPGMTIRPLIECYDPYNTIFKAQRALANEVVLITKKEYYRNQFTGLSIRDNNAATVQVNFPPNLPNNQTLFKVETGSLREEIKDLIRKKGIKGIIDRGNGINIGSDPEIFVTDAKGVVIPAYDFLPTKSLTTTTPDQPYWDGFQAEFNLLPTTCHASIVDHYQHGLKTVLAAAKTKFPSKKPRLSYKSVVDIPADVMKAATNKQAELGCAPSLNAYDVEPLNISEPRHIAIRFAGCHIHYGIGKKDDLTYRRYVKSIDRIGGPIMTSMLAGLEDPRRRQFYGKAGEYRTPAHGLEYRVPSSTVLVHPIVAHLTLDLCRYGIQFAILNQDTLWQMPGGDNQAQHILNNYDIDEARRILRLNEKILNDMITIVYSIAPDTVNMYQELPKKKFNKIKNIIMEGAKEHLPCDSIENNWRLELGAPRWQNHSDSPDASVVTMNF